MLNETNNIHNANHQVFADSDAVRFLKNMFLRIKNRPYLFYFDKMSSDDKDFQWHKLGFCRKDKYFTSWQKYPCLDTKHNYHEVPLSQLGFSVTTYTNQNNSIPCMQCRARLPGPVFFKGFMYNSGYMHKFRPVPYEGSFHYSNAHQCVAQTIVNAPPDLLIKINDFTYTRLFFNNLPLTPDNESWTIYYTTHRARHNTYPNTNIVA